ncbi:MAG: hypothetical protein WED05_11970 [Candidatus Atabeyarchaeum deiterrae]
MSPVPPRFKVNRQVERGIHALTSVFVGLEQSSAFMKIFKTEQNVRKFLEGMNLRIEEGDGYMYVDPSIGHIIVSKKYLQEGEIEMLYLDIIHESVHVKQWSEGNNLYDTQYSYVERPTELEAYAVVVDEARQMGMTEEQIVDYLEVPWISKKDLRLLAKKLGIEK